MSFNTPNSSFIFDLLLRSIRLCAVFRAILRPATLVEDGCFFLGEGAFAGTPFGASLGSSAISSTGPFGFICIIFLDLVGGGGSAKVSWVGFWASEDLRRVLTASLTGIAGDVGEIEYVWCEEMDDEFEDGRVSVDVTAGGGSSKDIWTPENWEPSLLLISVEDAGVGGCCGRGIVSLVVVLGFSGLVDWLAMELSRSTG